jgi:hypothetical protein
MTKKTSSASAGTRKKNARKAAKGAEDPEEGAAPKQKTQQGKNKKLSKAQKRALPKAKRYVPPPKPPAPPIPNPLDSQGLANQLPAELVVSLRGLGKKDDVTRRKALEELKEGWVGQVTRGEGDEVDKEVKEAALQSSVPVWVRSLQLSIQLFADRPATQLSEHASIAFPPQSSSITTQRYAHDTLNKSIDTRDFIAFATPGDAESRCSGCMARHGPRRRSAGWRCRDQEMG